jgi:hypothetical protein
MLFAGANVSVPVPSWLITGCVENNALLSFVTVNVKIWLASLSGPALIAVAQFGTECTPEFFATD